MKKLFYLILALFISLPNIAQETNDPCFSANDFSNLIVESNPPISVNLPEGWSMFGFSCNEPIDVIDAFQEISSDISIVKNYLGLAYLPDWGFNGMGDLEPGFGYQIKLEVAKNDLTFCDGILIPEIFGCTDCESENFNVWATINDGSCIYYGCTDPDFLEYNSNANTNDGSCLTPIVLGCTNPGYLEYNPEANIGGEDFCITEIIFGCTDQNYLEYWNYDEINQTITYSENIPNFDDGSCSIIITTGCTDPNYIEFSNEFNVADFNQCITIIVYGCTDVVACNFNAEAHTDDNSCLFPELGYNCGGEIMPYIGMEAYGGIIFYIDESGASGLVVAENDLNNDYPFCYSNIDLQSYNPSGIGLDNNENMNIGEGYQNTINIYDLCPTVSAASASIDYDNGGYNDWFLPSYDELELMIQTVDINLWNISTSDTYISSSEWNDNNCMSYHFFAGFGTLAKTSQARVRPIRTFGHEEIIGCTDSIFIEYNPNADISSNNSCLNVIDGGCTDNEACNYDNEAINDDGSCEFPTEGYDCIGNLLPYIGQIAYGGIVFHIDNSGVNGLVIAQNELDVHYEWGCYGIDIQEYNPYWIGSGYENTLHINDNCEGEHAASVALNYSNGSYTDWHLPSLNELQTAFSLTHDLFNSDCCYANGAFWTSTEANNNNASAVGRDGGNNSPTYQLEKNSYRKVIPIRSFCMYEDVIGNCNGNCESDNNQNGICDSNEVFGCTNELAVNFDATANIDDGTCNIFGCTDPNAENYNEIANQNDGSCLIHGCTDENMFNYNEEANFNNGSCIPYIYGCTNSSMYNYNEEANTDDNSCIPFTYGCTDTSMFNFDEEANTNDDSCEPIVEGCMDITACNYDQYANTDNESCNEYIVVINDIPSNICFDGLSSVSQDFSSTLVPEVLGLPYEVISYNWSIISSNSSSAIQTSVDTYNVAYEFTESGAYTLEYSVWIDGTDSDCNYTDIVVFNVGVDASISYNETICVGEDFIAQSEVDVWSSGHVYEWTTSSDLIIDNPSSPTTTISSETALGAGNWGSYDISLTVTNAVGCWETEQGEIEVYEVVADFTLADSILHCSPQEGYITSLNNEWINTWSWFVDESLNETSQIFVSTPTYIHSFTDQGSSDIVLEITSVHGCSDVITYEDRVLLNNYTASIDAVPASICFDGLTSVSQDFSSTLVPEVLGLPYEVIDYNWSIISSNSSSAIQTFVDMYNVAYEFTESGAYTLEYSVWIDGTDSDCNYTNIVEFNVGGVDGSCGYEVGDFGLGGIIYYIDESGEHGLVAALEDLMQDGCDCDNPNGYEWGCSDIPVDGADLQAIGTGYQNTLDIMNHGCQAIDGITAAEATLNFETEGYNDWYLPSLNELAEMYYAIGEDGGFVENAYYSSSERDDARAWTFNFQNGIIDSSQKRYDVRIRPIRSF